MKALLALLPVLLFALAPITAVGEPAELPVPLLEEASKVAETSPAVPEPRSIIFVGLGGLVILAFAMRRK